VPGFLRLSTPVIPKFNISEEFNNREKKDLNEDDDYFTMTLNDHPKPEKASIYHGVLGWAIITTMGWREKADKR
jgi:hypothetical protein